MVSAQNYAFKKLRHEYRDHFNKIIQQCKLRLEPEKGTMPRITWQNKMYRTALAELVEIHRGAYREFYQEARKRGLPCNPKKKKSS